MASNITNGNTNYTRQFVPLDELPIGSGETGFKEDIVGVLVGFEKRPGMYEFTDQNGQRVSKPNTWIAHFEGGLMFNWTTFLNEETGAVEMWHRFDPEKINLRACIEQRIPLHVWRDERRRMHLELAQFQRQAQPQYQQQQGYRYGSVEYTSY